MFLEADIVTIESKIAECLFFLYENSQIQPLNLIDVHETFLMSLFVLLKIVLCHMFRMQSNKTLQTGVRYIKDRIKTAA